MKSILKLLCNRTVTWYSYVFSTWMWSLTKQFTAFCSWSINKSGPSTSIQGFWDTCSLELVDLMVSFGKKCIYLWKDILNHIRKCFFSTADKPEYFAFFPLLSVKECGNQLQKQSYLPQDNSKWTIKQTCYNHLPAFLKF